MRRFWQLFVRMRVLRFVLLLLLLPPLLLTLAFAGLKTEAGRNWLVAEINRSGVVRLQDLDGSPWGTLVFSGLEIETAGVHVKTDLIKLHLRPYALLARHVHVRTLEIGTLEYQIKPTPSVVPTSLELPWAVSLDQARIHILKMAGRDLTEVALRFNSSGRFHRLDQLQLQSEFGLLCAEVTLDGRAPFMATGAYRYEGQLEGRPVKSSGQASGGLRELKVDAEVQSGGEISSHVDARLDVFAEHAYQMLRSGKVRLREINPARFAKEWPVARLDIVLDLEPTGPNQARGHIAIHNAAPGTLDHKMIPASALTADLAYEHERVTFHGLKLDLPGGSQIGGRGQIDLGQLDLDLQVTAFDLARIWSRQPASAMSGQLAIKGPWLAPDIRADLADTRHRAHLRADLGWVRTQPVRRLLIREAELARGEQKVAFKGEFDLARNFGFDLTGQLAGFDPAQWVEAPTGRIAGHFTAKGEVAPQPAVDLDFQLQESRFNGQLLAGGGQLHLNRQSVSGADFRLELGRNRVDVTGGLGRDGDVLKLVLDCSDLGQLGRDFAGSGKGNLSLSGSLSRPLIDGGLDFSGVQTPWGIRAQRLQVSGRVQEGDRAPWQMNLEAGQLEYDGYRIQSLQASVDGVRVAHTFLLKMTGEQAGMPYTLDSRLTGGFVSGGFWRGELQHLQVNGVQSLALAHPVALEFSAQDLRLAPARIDLAGGRFNLQTLAWQDGRLQTSGDFSGAALQPWLQLFNREAGSDLVLGGRWNLQWRDGLDGEASIWRESGESVWRVQAIKRFSPALQAAQLDLKARRSWLTLDAHAQSSRFGEMRLTGEALLDPLAGGLSKTAPLTLQLSGQLPDLAAFNVMTGPDFLLTGAVDFEFAHRGRLKDGHFSGELVARNLGIKDPMTGLDLHDGLVRLGVEDQQLVLREMLFRGGQGQVRGSGRLDYHDGDPAGQAEVVFERLRLFGRPDFLLVLSGQAGLRIDHGRVDLTGRLKADEGDLRYRSVDIPRLSDDVRVLGVKKEEAQRLPKIGLQLDVDLGERFRFRGFGADASLTGLLRLRAEPAKPLGAYGTVQVANGYYRAYGRKLDIEQGLLAFQGPIDNPEIDILAMRRNMTVEAGVTVKGTARNPRVQLYSEPTVADNEKLSWLLFGHDTNNMEGTDSTILLHGLSALLTDDDGGPGLPERVLDTVGIEEVEFKTVKSTDSKPTQVMTITKRIGQNLQFSIEKSVNGLNDAVKLVYQLSQRWSLVTRWGTDENSLEASYTFRFD